jgi:hypothetical protein
MNEKSILMPPKGAEKFASRLDPPEYGTIPNQHQSQHHSDGLTHRDLVLVADLGNMGNFLS